MVLPVSDQRSEMDENQRDVDPKWAIRRTETMKNVDLAIRKEHNEGLGASTVPEENEWNYWTIFYSLLLVIACLFSSFGVTLVPQHNSFEQPEYWYESIISQSLSVNAYFVVMAAIRLKIFFKDDFCLEMSVPFMKMYLATLLGYNGASAIFHLIWSVYMEFKHPIPWLGILSFFGYVPAYFISLWYIFPPEFRSTVQGRKKIFNFFGYLATFYTACPTRMVVTTLFARTPTEMQPIWALLFPIVREFDYWMHCYWMVKATNGKIRDAKIITITELNSNYNAFLLVAIGQWATNTASYCILGFEFLINLSKCVGIIRMSRKINSDPAEKEKLEPLRQEAVQDLLLVELAEMLMPLVYISTILMAFYGPNGKILGNIRNSYWNYKEIDDMSGLLIAVFRMFSLDVLAAALTILLLWKLTTINGITVLVKHIEYYGSIICITLASGVIKVCFT